MTVVARDTFQRVTAGGWGTADAGGAWTNVGGTAQVSTDGSAAVFSVTTNSERDEYLGISTRDQYSLFRVKVATIPATGGTQLYTLLRRVDANNYYSATLTINNLGQVSCQVNRRLAGVLTTLAADTATQINGADGDPLVANEWFWVRAEAVGASPTTIRAKVWKDGDIEQAFWFTSVTDSAAALQVAAGFGYACYANIASPPVMSIDDLTVSDAPITYGMTLTMSSATVKASRMPPDTTLQYVAVPTVARPAVGVPMTDPTYGTKVTRISSTNLYHNDYPNLQPWNSDQSILAFWFANNPRPFYDGTTYAFIKTMQTGKNPIWSNSDPDKIWNTDDVNGLLRTVSYSTGAFTTIRTFTGYNNLYIGDYGGRPDRNERYFPMLATAIAGGANTIMIYDRQADSIIATESGGLPHRMGMSYSGNYVVCNYASNGTGNQQGIWLMDKNLVRIRQLYTFGGRHGDFVQNEAGRDVFVLCNPPVAEELPTGIRTVLLNGHNPEALRYGHVSGAMFDYPGWVGFSNYDTVSSAGQPGVDQIALIKLDGSGTMKVFAHAHHGGDVYNADPFAAWSRDGKRVAFASEWAGDPNTESYGFIAEMP